MEHNDFKEAHNLSETNGCQSSYDEYESEHDSSDCSVTSGLKDDCLRKAITYFSDMPDVDSLILEPDESANSTWTDDKHNSYLDSIEATFVQKMYDKGYCSLDVCGYSSQSSTTWDLECVESHPFCLNMRKPVGLQPLRKSGKPPLSTSSMLANPWIQHFKAKQVASAKNSEANGHATNTEVTEAPNLLASTKHVLKPTPAMHDTISNTILKKRAGLFELSDCMQFGVISRSFRGTLAGGFKKLKCKQSLSEMDMVMEEQYNKEQQNQGKVHLDQQNEGVIPSEVANEEFRMLQTKADESRESTEVPEPRLFKEKQSKAIHMEVGLETAVLSKELFSKKPDQVVPSIKRSDRGGEQNIAQDKAMPTKAEDMYILSGHKGEYLAEEVCLSLHSREQENTPTQLSSKTWTWGSQGPRYRLGEAMSPGNVKH